MLLFKVCKHFLQRSGSVGWVTPKAEIWGPIYKISADKRRMNLRKT